MGHVIQDVVLVGRRRKKVRMLVDTGATYTVLPRPIARTIGLPPPLRRVEVHLADGTVRRLPQTSVGVRIDGREAASIVLVVPEGEPLLGVEALEALGLAVDPKGGRLIPTRPYAVRLGGYRRR